MNRPLLYGINGEWQTAAMVKRIDNPLIRIYFLEELREALS